MSSSSMLFRGGRGIRLLAFQHFPTLTTASTSSSTRIVSFSSYPYPTSYKIFSRNHCTFQNIFKLSLTSPSGCGVVGFSKMASAAGGEDGHFKLSETSELIIKKGDITRWFVDGASDAIVNPANQRMLGGGGADGAIHRAAGPELREACYKVPEVRPDVCCPTGEARITPGFKLPASHVIHTVGPIYDTDKDPKASLSSAYKNSLAVAKENNIKYIAFPSISCGVYGYPFEEAATVAISTVKEYANDIKEVHFVLFADGIYNIWLNKAKELLQA
ncbi:PREDICTED: macro domain-containing protein VPA0103 isoform X1 [Theobroma cacao]|uniref:Macro domain-containing protein VPA0103 isoform X1 n=2 Tax=Theobroma cacao TaxID=3641 RepID=A0AB32X2F0_THECC|nr:PREDICTED: macro domain-containing protein VPA0103 isoform X1 [Theobroma cacao]